MDAASKTKSVENLWMGLLVATLILEKDQSRGARGKWGLWCTWRWFSILLENLRGKLVLEEVHEIAGFGLTLTELS